MTEDRSVCPLCGENNSCGMLRGETTCWCFEARISEATLNAIPSERRGVSCICRACAERSSEAPAPENAR